MSVLYIKSVILTFIQYSCLIAIFFINSWFVNNLVLFLIQLTGIFIGVWAIYEMRRSKLNIAPHIRKGAILITSGPYHFVRHPMYLALLLLLLPMINENQSTLNFFVFSVFLVNLLLKLLYEEGLLRNQFDNYSDYAKKTKRLIPGIF